MKRFFTFLNILELLSLSLFLLFSLFFLSDFRETAIGKVFHHYLGGILWWNLMYGGTLELLTIPIALMMHFTSKAPFTYALLYLSIFIIKIVLWVYIMTRGAIGY